MQKENLLAKKSINKGALSKKQSNVPIPLVRSILKRLNIFFVVVSIEGLYFPCITLLGPSGQGGHILLMGEK